MDVDASERRPDGGRRRIDSPPRRRGKRAGIAHPGRGPVMEKPGGLSVIDDPVVRLRRKTTQLKLICLYEAAVPRPLGRPWPRQFDWRSLGSGLESGPATRQQV
jgi:hypothetical protein